MMDTHDVGRGRGGIKQALASVAQPVLIISIDSDILYPPCEQETLARCIKNSERHLVRSDNGHDGFLLDQEAVETISKTFLSKFCPKIVSPREVEIQHAAKARAWGLVAIQAKASL